MVYQISEYAGDALHTIDCTGDCVRKARQIRREESGYAL